MVFPCNEIQKTAWNELKNFDHAVILREEDPLLPAVSDVYEKQGIKNGLSQNMMKGEVFKTELATAYPDNNIDRCPLYGISLNEEGVCPKCGDSENYTMEPVEYPDRLHPFN